MTDETSRQLSSPGASPLWVDLCVQLGLVSHVSQSPTFADVWSRAPVRNLVVWDIERLVFESRDLHAFQLTLDWTCWHNDAGRSNILEVTRFVAMAAKLPEDRPFGFVEAVASRGLICAPEISQELAEGDRLEAALWAAARPHLDLLSVHSLEVDAEANAPWSWALPGEFYRIERGARRAMVCALGLGRLLMAPHLAPAWVAFELARVRREGFFDLLQYSASLPGVMIPTDVIPLDVRIDLDAIARRGNSLETWRASHLGVGALGSADPLRTLESSVSRPDRTRLTRLREAQGDPSLATADESDPRAPGAVLSPTASLRKTEDDPSELPTEDLFERLLTRNPSRLLAYLRDPDLDPTLLTFAAEIAGRLPDDRPVAPLLELLAHPKAYVREGAVYGLALHPQAHGVRDALAHIRISDTSAGVRAAADEQFERLWESANVDRTRAS